SFSIASSRFELTSFACSEPTGWTLISFAIIRVFAVALATSPALAFAWSECTVPPRVIVFLSLSSDTVTSFKSACSKAFLTSSLYETLSRREQAKVSSKAANMKSVAKAFISGPSLYLPLPRRKKGCTPRLLVCPLRNGELEKSPRAQAGGESTRLQHGTS